MFARTPRLLLRPGWAEDAPALAETIAHEAIAFKLARLPWPYTVSHAEQFLGLERRASDANFLIFARTHGEPRLIGGIGLHGEDGETEIGYWLAPHYWGLGFATEAGRAVMEIARHTLRLPRLVSGHFTDNPASGNVLRKLGFRPTGKIVPRYNLARGRELPCVLYAAEFDAEDAVNGNIDMRPQLMAA